LKTGIGGWPKQAFVRAMREGVDAKGRHLYPAFPYRHFTRLRDDDLDALYAFLMTRQPVDAPRLANEILWPLRFRPLLAAWKLMFLDRDAVRPVADRSPEWNRGAYLVEALAHCGACHTPRNLFYAEKRHRGLAGGDSENWYAPPLNAQSPAPLPWSRSDLISYLSAGFSANHGLAAGPMAEVARSLARVPQADVAAIATYIASLSSRPTLVEERTADLIIEVAKQRRERLSSEALAPVRKGGALDVGAGLYHSACARCHEPLHPGTPSLAQPLTLSTVLRGDDARNLVHIVLAGLAPEHTSARLRMPAFRGIFDQYQIKSLALYLRTTLTDRPVWTDIDDVVHTLDPSSGTARGK
jgi:mono/diheme cytochrome c family protein